MKLLKVYFLFCLIFSFHSIADAQSFRENALIGLDSLSVELAITINNYESEPLERALQNRVELRLRQNGISVVSGDKNDFDVYISGLDIMRNERIIGYTFHSSLTLSQEAFLVENSKFMFPYTYSSDKLSISSEENIEQNIRSSIEELLDEFINEFLKVN